MNGYQNCWLEMESSVMFIIVNSDFQTCLTGVAPDSKVSNNYWTPTAHPCWCRLATKPSRGCGLSLIYSSRGMQIVAVLIFRLWNFTHPKCAHTYTVYIYQDYVMWLAKCFIPFWQQIPSEVLLMGCSLTSIAVVLQNLLQE